MTKGRWMANAITIPLRFLISLNTLFLRIGRNIAWVALALMVVVILVQVFFRYVLNSALPWPDEAARFLMLWMTGLMAPLAYRHGGFVAIEMAIHGLPEKLGRLLALALFAIGLVVVTVGISFGWDHSMGFGGNFDSSSLKIPLDLIGLESIRLKLRYMYLSLFVCMVLLFLVSLELILRLIVDQIWPGLLPPLKEDEALQQAEAS